VESSLVGIGRGRLGQRHQEALQVPQIGHHGPEPPFRLVWPVASGGERHVKQEVPHIAQGGVVLGEGEVDQERLPENQDQLVQLQTKVADGSFGFGRDATRKYLILKSIPNGIRTRVAALKGHSPRPPKAARVR
jgi:hypothetical protein